MFVILYALAFTFAPAETISVLRFVVKVAIVIEIVSVALIILFAVMEYFYYRAVEVHIDKLKEDRKAQLRFEKERIAHETFFDHPYIRGFDAKGDLIHRGQKVPPSRALDYYETMEKLESTQTFSAIKE